MANGVVVRDEYPIIPNKTVLKDINIGKQGKQTQPEQGLQMPGF